MRLLKLSSLCFSLFITWMSYAQEFSGIVPLPAEYKAIDGHFVIDKNTNIVFDSKNQELKKLANYFVSHIAKVSGVKLAVNAKKNTNAIRLRLVQAKELGKEGYRLQVAPSRINLEASDRAGIFYGMQSIFQTLPAIRTNAALHVPAMQVVDKPRFGWRGFMLDVSRHFYSPDAIKDILDLMASFKMNVFHWHLCDDQGWRLEIKKYPKLTSIGAWRQEKEGAVFYEKDTAHLHGKNMYTYGGYYTQEQVKDIVAYAAMRNITVVPEIEMPGHSGAALAAYPQLSCTKRNVPVPNIVNSGYLNTLQSNYCPGNDSSFIFLQDVLTEVMQLFPSKYIHIGGDEVDKKDWKACASCQALMKKENLKDEEELQSYFIKRMSKYITSTGHKMIGWGEILEGGLAPDATVMSWIGEKRGIEAARLGHDVIMTPSNPLYLNRYQTDSIQYEPKAAKYSINTLEKVYAYNPLPQALTAKEQQHILGAQAVIWTEFIRSVDHLHYMLLPRMCALAEVVWTPKEKQDFNAFKQRMKPRLAAFEQSGFRFYNKDY